jgi:hypothetical protein
MFRRNGVFYIQDNQSGRQESLHTRSRADAEKLFHAKNEAAQGPMLNRDLGRVYLSASDPDSTRPTWSAVMEELRSHDRPVSIAQALTHELDYVGVAVRFLRRNHRRSG